MSALTDDVVALGRLQARYADVISRRAFPELDEIFRPDVVVTIDTVSRPERRIVGPQDFGAFVAAAIERYDHFTFVILNAVIDVEVDGTGDEAEGRMFMCEIRHDRASDAWQNAHGVYQDRYVRVDGRWWFAARRYRSLARTGPHSEILGLPPPAWFSG